MPTCEGPADDIVIRPAIAADRPFLQALDPRLIGEASVPGVARDDFIRFQSRYTQAALDAPAKGAATLVATDGEGAPLGYIHLEPTEDALTGATVGYVSILAVRAEVEGRGIAKRLMAEAERWALARGYRFLLLDVFASNVTARRFYERQGFAEDSLRLRRPVGT